MDEEGLQGEFIKGRDWIVAGLKVTKYTEVSRDFQGWESCEVELMGLFQSWAGKHHMWRATLHYMAKDVSSAQGTHKLPARCTHGRDANTHHLLLWTRPSPDHKTHRHNPQSQTATNQAPHTPSLYWVQGRWKDVGSHGAQSGSSNTVR